MKLPKGEELEEFVTKKFKPLFSSEVKPDSAREVACGSSSSSEDENDDEN